MWAGIMAAPPCQGMIWAHGSQVSQTPCVKKTVICTTLTPAGQALSDWDNGFCFTWECGEDSLGEVKGIRERKHKFFLYIVANLKGTFCSNDCACLKKSKSLLLRGRNISRQGLGWVETSLSGYVPGGKIFGILVSFSVWYGMIWNGMVAVTDLLWRLNWNMYIKMPSMTDSCHLANQC